ncbi:Uncharacterized protein APZ42_005165 [Daphnia magna]|uniref:Uncharacterized protein n=1 Tax=Daphnia magna TaxID=35525 RepID=A0A164GLX9_9CRUS|nr:Uncharacterized protein APZ42_005165 [Daphnia magna]
MNANQHSDVINILTLDYTRLDVIEILFLRNLPSSALRAALRHN